MYNNIEWSISRMFREAKFPISDTQHGKQALTLLKLGGDIRIHFNPMKNTKTGLFQKKSTHPRRMGSFFNPPSHLDFLKHKDPPPHPSHLPGIPGKNIRLKFNLFLIENTHNHI